MAAMTAILTATPANFHERRRTPAMQKSPQIGALRTLVNSDEQQARNSTLPIGRSCDPGTTLREPVLLFTASLGFLLQSWRKHKRAGHEEDGRLIEEWPLTLRQRTQERHTCP
jgi:hypothetical protein